MNNSKKILITIMVLVICIILILIALLMLNKQKGVEEDNPTTIAFEDIEKIDNKPLFFQIQNNVENYMRYLKGKNTEAINAISPKGVMVLDNTKNYTTFLANKMYAIDKISNITVYVNELARGENIEDNYYLIINLDYQNNTFEIIPSSKEEFESAKNNQIKENHKKDISIAKNNYNSINQTNLTDFEILKKYFDDYKFKAINKSELAFELIDLEYKMAKFNNNIEEYKRYIQNNVNSLKDANIVKHGITKNGQYGEYIFYDNYNNYYKIKETGIYEYTIILDNYTLQSNELINQYNKLSNQEKVLSNIDKVMKLINTKDYNKVYSYLNQNFKKQYFPSIDVFTQYMKQNFFDNNIVGNITIKQEGDIYIVSVPYKESLSTAAQKRTKTFMIRLKEGTNFELSFER